MEIPPALLPHVRAGVQRWTGEDIAALGAAARDAFSAVLDALGAESGVAQGLKGPLTTAAKLYAHPDRRCYVLNDCDEIAGILTLGSKHLRDCRAEMLSIGPGVARAFKRTMPAVQRCKNYPKPSSSRRTRSTRVRRPSGIETRACG